MKNNNIVYEISPFKECKIRKYRRFEDNIYELIPLKSPCMYGYGYKEELSVDERIKSENKKRKSYGILNDRVKIIYIDEIDLKEYAIKMYNDLGYINKPISEMASIHNKLYNYNYEDKIYFSLNYLSNKSCIKIKYKNIIEKYFIKKDIEDTIEQRLHFMFSQVELHKSLFINV